jgi:flagellar biosynthesis protein
MSGSGRQTDPGAVALHYDGSGAPSVTAKGRGEVARRIIHLAQEHGVPIRKDPVLITALSHVPLGEEIPQALYVAVAEVLAFVYQLSGKTPGAAKGR